MTSIDFKLGIILFLEYEKVNRNILQGSRLEPKKNISIGKTIPLE